jgi:hypothetical protein
MRTKTAYLSALAVSAACVAAMKIGEVVLEYRDVQNFSISEHLVDGGREIEISGLAFHSSLAVERMTTEVKGDSLLVRVILVRAREGLSGRFKFTVSVPREVKTVVFGDQLHEIWPSR